MLFLLACGPADPVPSELRDLRAGAEEAFDRALVPDSAAVEDRAAKLSAAWASFRPTAEEDGADAGALEGMDGALALLELNAGSSVDSVVLGRACNGVLAWMDELYEGYGPAAPVALIEVATYARAVWMDARNGDIPGQAAADLGEQRGAWDGVKGQVVELGYADEAAALDEAIDAQEAALADQDTGALELASEQAVGAAGGVEAAYR